MGCGSASDGCLLAGLLAPERSEMWKKSELGPKQLDSVPRSLPIAAAPPCWERAMSSRPLDLKLLPQGHDKSSTDTYVLSVSMRHFPTLTCAMSLVSADRDSVSQVCHDHVDLESGWPAQVVCAASIDPESWPTPFLPSTRRAVPETLLTIRYDQ